VSRQLAFYKFIVTFSWHCQTNHDGPLLAALSLTGRWGWNGTYVHEFRIF